MSKPSNPFALAACLGLSIAACTHGSTSGVPDAPNAREGEPTTEETTMAVREKSEATESPEELRARLTPLQYEVTQNEGTEPAFRNEYWDNHEAGLYVDVVSGEPLFSSADKFDSGTGWPSFTRPIAESAVERRRDASHGMERVEARSTKAGSHLGHVFDDGPAPTGERWCINSAALRFVPLADFEKEGYGAQRKLFDGQASAQGGAQQDAAPATATTETAILAGGCFWGMEDILREHPGVLDTEVGYTGGTVKNATYENHEGHAEAIQVVFDPTKTSYAVLLDLFFRMHDPTTKNRQGNDVGTSYRSAIFYRNDAQKKEAEAAIERANASGRWKRPIATEVTPFTEWWTAEAYHQDYLEKHPGGYTCHFLRD